MAERVRKEVGPVEVLVNNAGILNGGPLLKMSEVDIRRCFEINIMAYIWVSNRGSNIPLVLEPRQEVMDLGQEVMDLGQVIMDVGQEVMDLGQVEVLISIIYLSSFNHII